MENGDQGPPKKRLREDEAPAGAEDNGAGSTDEAQAAQDAMQAAMQAAAAATAAAAVSTPTVDSVALNLQQAAASLGLNVDASALLRQLTGALGGSPGGDASAALSQLAGAASGGLSQAAVQQALAEATNAAAQAAGAGGLGGAQPFNLLEGAGALSQHLAGTSSDALAALAAQMQPGSGGANGMMGSLAQLDPFMQLQTLGLRYQAHMDEKDTQMLEHARRAHNVMQITVQVLQVPNGVTTDGTLPAVELELPGTADLACLKRAVSRASAGLLPPHSQRYFVSDTGAPLSGDSNLLVTWELSSGSQLYLVVVDNEPSHSLRVHQVSAGDFARLLPAAVAMEPEDDGQGYGGAYLDASEDGDGRRPMGGKPGSTSNKKVKREAGEEGEGPAPTRQRFTEDEILALVEGVRLFGTSWARIKSAFSQQLARRTQVNIKDKWRNLQRGLQTNWRDERSHLSEDTKEKIRQLNEALQQQQYQGLPAGLPLLPVLPGGDMSGMPLAAFAQAQLNQSQLAAMHAAMVATAQGNPEGAPGSGIPGEQA